MKSKLRDCLKGVLALAAFGLIATAVNPDGASAIRRGGGNLKAVVDCEEGGTTETSLPNPALQEEIDLACESMDNPEYCSVVPGSCRVEIY